MERALPQEDLLQNRENTTKTQGRKGACDFALGSCLPATMRARKQRLTMVKAA